MNKIHKKLGFAIFSFFVERKNIHLYTIYNLCIFAKTLRLLIIGASTLTPKVLKYVFCLFLKFGRPLWLEF